MQHDFWHNKWQTNNIGFHLDQPHSLLTQYLSSLNLAKNARIFVPLCGKSLDLAWLLDQGYHVIGIDLSPVAIQDLMSNLGLNFKETQIGGLTYYQHAQIELFTGNFFELTADHLGKIDAIYDRAALIALPEQMLCVTASKITRQTNQIFISTSRSKLWQQFQYKHSEQFKGYSKTELEHFYLCIEACLAGLGATLVSTYMVEREIKHQLLQPISSIYQDESAYFLLSAEPFEEDVRKVLFCDWLRGQMQTGQLEFGLS